MNTPIQKPRRMTAEEFVVWAEQQPSGRYELFEGEVLAMAPERIAHARAKVDIFDRLRAAIKEAGLPCEAFLDGVGFAVDQQTVFIPDVMVRCGDPPDDQLSLLSDPVIVVEVLSPSTQGTDTSIKLEQYFSVGSVMHYLIVRTSSPVLIHHRRTDDGIATRIVKPGPLHLDPPGITLRLD